MDQINITALRHSVFSTPLLMTICRGFLEGVDFSAIRVIDAE